MRITKQYISIITQPVIIELFIFISIIFLSVNTPCPVHAQNLSLSISPPILEVLIKPGKSITQVYRLKNDGDPITITPKIAEYTPEGILERPVFDPEGWITIISSGLSFGQPFTLAKGMEKQIIVKISPPGEADEKEYYRAILFTTGTGPSQNTSQSALVEKIASVLFVTVSSSGRLEKSGFISDFRISRIIDSVSPLLMTINVKNTGLRYFRPVGEIIIRGLTGIQTYKLKPLVILPGQTRQLTADVSSASSLKSQDPTLKVPGFFFGKYEAEASFTLDQSNIRVSRKVVFYAVPWKISLVLLVFLFFVRLVFFRSRKPNK